MGSRFEERDGRAMICYKGEPQTACYSETFPKGMNKRNLQMAKAGCQVFMLIVRGGYDGDYSTSWFWKDDGVYGDEAERTDGLRLVDQAEAILAEHPDALFMVRWASGAPKRWGLKHPGELQVCAKGRMSDSSYASAVALEGRKEMARRIVRYCEAQPWGERVLAYMPFGQDEGTHHMGMETPFDQSAALQRAFIVFLQNKYQTDAALQAAWQDDKATFATASPPTDAQWQADRARWKMHWPEPRESQRYQDYFLCYRDLIIWQRSEELSAVHEVAGRPVIAGTDALKQPMFGWLLRDAFYSEAFGMDWHNILLTSGSIGVAPLLDHEALDALITPADYTARSNGFGWDGEGIGDSLVLRGKTLLIEDDARSWASDERITQGAWRDRAEAVAGLRRNLCIAASRGLFPYWMNVGRGYFDDPVVLEVVAEQIPLRRQLLTRALVPTEHVIALIIDDMSPLDEDVTAGFQNLAVLRQRNDHLSMTGLPWRIYLLSDLARDNFPVCRMYLLPNLFRLTAEKEALIREKLFRKGSLTLFGPATGISDGETLSGEPASRLLDMPLALERKATARRVLVYGGAHPAVAEVHPSTTYGDSYIYGPLLHPTARPESFGAVELGKASTHWYNNTAGLILKEFADHSVVFSMATPMPAALLRSLALHAGCNPWSALGDVVAANGNMVAVHTMTPGRREIRLPAVAARVTDAVTGEVIAKECASFQAELTAPDTQVYLYDA